MLGTRVLKFDFSHARRSGPVYRKQIALLRAIEQTLRPHLPEYATHWNYTYWILPGGDEYSASSLSGGTILFSEGSFSTKARVDDIAVILAHEMAHVALRHITYRSTVDAVKPIDMRMLIVEQEREADIFSARVASSAGYDVHSMARAHEDTYDPSFESSIREYSRHPSPLERAEILRCFAGTAGATHEKVEKLFYEAQNMQHHLLKNRTRQHK
jgi:Zn-dependent protease with chaperone function